MGQKYAQFPPDGGKILAFYDSIDSPPPDGVPLLEITDEEWQVCISSQGWAVSEDGALIPPPPAPPSIDAVFSEIVARVDEMMEVKAREAGYFSKDSLIGYAAGSLVAAWQAEGVAFRNWRDSVWLKCYALRDEVISGVRPMMSAEQVIAALPPLITPK